MPEFDSLSFALLIPFAICFALVFIVCCFADEIKDICRMPSPLPRSYLTPQHTDQSRRNNRRPSRSNRPRNEEFRNLILSEEGRSRNVSESSTEYISANNLLANSVSNLNLSRQNIPRLHQNVMILPQTMVPNGKQRATTSPSTSGVLLHRVENNAAASSCVSHGKIQPLHQFGAQNLCINTNKNLARNLTIHASASSKDLHSCFKQTGQCDTKVTKSNNEPSLNRNDSAPQLLNSYLSRISPSANTTTLPQTRIQETTVLKTMDEREADTNSRDQ